MSTKTILQVLQEVNAVALIQTLKARGYDLTSRIDQAPQRPQPTPAKSAPKMVATAQKPATSPLPGAIHLIDRSRIDALLSGVARASKQIDAAATVANAVATGLPAAGPVAAQIGAIVKIVSEISGIAQTFIESPTLTPAQAATTAPAPAPPATAAQPAATTAPTPIAAKP